MAEVLIAGIEHVRAHTRQIRAVRARGLMVAIELEDDALASYTTVVRQTL